MGELGTESERSDLRVSVAAVMIKPFERAIATYGDDATRRGQLVRKTLLAKYGLTDSALAQAGRVPYLLVLEDLRRQAHQVGNDALALIAAPYWKLGDYGLGDYLNASCSNVQECLQTIAEFVPLANSGFSFSLEEHGERALLRFEFAPGAAPHRNMAEAALAQVVAQINQAASGDPSAKPQAVHFAHAPPRYEHAYEQTFGAPVEFRQGHDALLFDARALRVPFHSADGTLHGILRRQAMSALQATGVHPQPLLSDVRAAIQKELSRCGANQSMVARKVGMSPATLRRRLELEGVSYRDLVSEIQRERAARHLTSREAELNELHRHLGFSSKPAFYRAFRRWYGCTPLEYQRSVARRV